MVFQSYALYPHMSVDGNMGFALKMQKQDKASIASRVAKAGSRLGIGELMARRPKALSAAASASASPWGARSCAPRRRS